MAPAPAKAGAERADAVRTSERSADRQGLESDAKPATAASGAAPAHAAAQAAAQAVAPHAAPIVDEPGPAAPPVRAPALAPEPPVTRPDRVTLQLPDDAGGARIQVAVRGGAVEARIVSSDTALAGRLEAGLPELEGALGRRGFEEVRVSMPQARSGGEPAAAAWVPTAPGGAADTGDARRRGSPDPDRRPAPEDRSTSPGDRREDGRPNQRSRRERER
jgi:hypothetical protein